jgi:hypothetical protein
MRRPGRHSILALLGISAAAAVILPIYASAGPGVSPQAPDLRADPVGLVQQPAVYADGEVGSYGSGRLLVRFDGYVTNVGDGPLEVSGDPQLPASSSGGVKQRARTTPGQSPSVVVGSPEVLFETADGHDHFHLVHAMRYSLWTVDRTAQVAPGQKVGFCLYDTEAAPQPSPPQDQPVYVQDVTNFCDAGNPAATSLTMGTSRGWRDVYEQFLAYQWVDVSNTAPGVYVVGSEADPDNVIWEGGGAAEVNPPAFADSTPVTVPGWIAEPVTVPQTGALKTIPIRALRYGNLAPSDLRYRVVTGTVHGSLSVPAGQTFDPATKALVYTPPGGYRGPDGFQYVAVSASSGFPLSPPIASVALTDTRPSVTISGAPARLPAGTSVRLTAALANLTGGVRWSTSGGHIGTAGLLTAPDTVPKGGLVQVRATSTAQAAVYGQVAIRIVAASTGAKPGVAGTLTAGSTLLSPVAIRAVTKRILVTRVVTGRRAGRIAVTATVGRKVLGRCRARLRARQSFSCKIVLKRAYPLHRVRITARFTAGRTVAVRRAFVQPRRP